MTKEERSIEMRRRMLVRLGQAPSIQKQLPSKDPTMAAAHAARWAGKTAAERKAEVARIFKKARTPEQKKAAGSWWHKLSKAEQKRRIAKAVEARVSVKAKRAAALKKPTARDNRAAAKVPFVNGAASVREQEANQ
jgi:hypothetical protein